MLATFSKVLFTIILLVGVPALSYSTTRGREVRELPRMVLYVSATLSQWLLTGLGLGVVLLAAREVLLTSFRALPWTAALRCALSIASLVLLAQGLVVFMEHQGWAPRESDLVIRLLPRTSREKLWSVLILSPTAAVCEEFLFRGFLLTELTQWFHSVAWAWAVSSVAFGLGHCYQGWSGMVRAGLLGGLLAYPVVQLGSLYPSMLAHWVLDAMTLVGMGRWLMGKDTSTEASQR